MALPAITFIDPYVVDFVRWAAVLAEDLAQYNVPNPATEDLWASWANEFCGIPEIAELGVPNPEVFSDWRSWAAATSQVLN